MRRRVPLALICLLVVLVAAHTAYWVWATRTVATLFEQWASDRHAAGWTIRTGPGTSGGWPMRATLVLPDVEVTGGEAFIPGGFSWGARTVTLGVGLLEPRLLEITPEGPQHVALAGGPDLTYAAKRLVVQLPLQDEPPPDMADTRAEGLRLDLPERLAPARGVSVALLQAHSAWRAAPAGQAAVSTALDATEITLPPGARWPLGNRIAALSLDLVLSGPMLPPANPREQASRWRDGGGELEIRRFSLGWGPLGLSARGTLALDEHLQLAGTGDARLIGYSEAADMLATNGALTRSAATAAKAVLALLARLPEDGGAPEVDVPLTLQDRTLSMRRFPLARLPPLTWPEPSPDRANQ